MRDAATGRSRGFAFLSFDNPSSVDAVILKEHILDGKLIDPKRAIAREEQDKVGKIFVGGIDPMVTEKEFNEFFSQFGHIVDAQLMIDKDSGRSRGFGFITYDSADACDRVTVNKYLSLRGKAMEVKKAEPRNIHNRNEMQARQNRTQPSMQYPYGSQYGAQYGQMQVPGAQNAAYGQTINGMSPEMMQEYWQRMQQWYMFQQQQQGQDGASNEGQNDDNAHQPDQPDQQPLNPQQQAPILTLIPEIIMAVDTAIMEMEMVMGMGTLSEKKEIITVSQEVLDVVFHPVQVEEEGEVEEATKIEAVVTILTVEVEEETSKIY
ncbi:hypothetical protein QCA50_016272 [Cerrena zonata]|uniref:RRM domain-containing protein n=1 Tax=Cerrena zonata TaxID=2478898 RepID=A0AAW0FNW1_9APHY